MPTRRNALAASDNGSSSTPIEICASEEFLKMWCLPHSRNNSGKGGSFEMARSDWSKLTACLCKVLRIEPWTRFSHLNHFTSHNKHQFHRIIGAFFCVRCPILPSLCIT